MEQPELVTTPSSEGPTLGSTSATKCRCCSLSSESGSRTNVSNIGIGCRPEQHRRSGPLTPEEQRYIGLAITGKFDWGARILDAKQASITAKQAQAGLQVQRDAIELQLSSAKGALELAQTRLRNAQQKATLAEELLRQAEQTHQQQLLTTEALLEAETLVLEAHLSISESQKNVLLKYLDYRLLQGQSPLDIITQLEKQNPRMRAHNEPHFASTHRDCHDHVANDNKWLLERAANAIR